MTFPKGVVVSRLSRIVYRSAGASDFCVCEVTFLAKPVIDFVRCFGKILKQVAMSLLRHDS